MWTKRRRRFSWGRLNRQRKRARFLLRKGQRRRAIEPQKVWESAVLDRIVDGVHAVLLVGEKQEERVVPVERLGRVREGDWLRVCFCGPVLVAAEPDPTATQRARERIAQKMARLRQRGRKSSS